MKLKQLHTYQYVSWCGKNENFFSTAKAGMKDVEMVYQGDGSILISSPEDQIIVYTTNISYSKPAVDPRAAKKPTTTKITAPGNV